MSAVAVFEKKRPGPDAETRAGVEQGLNRPGFHAGPWV